MGAHQGKLKPLGEGGGGCWHKGLQYLSGSIGVQVMISRDVEQMAEDGLTSIYT